MTSTGGRTDVGVEVAIVGAGPAGLSAAAQLAGKHGRRTLVLDREKTPGGIPRHSDHVGYGIRDLHTFISGPAYARRLTRQALDAGADVLTQAMVTAIHPDNSLAVTTPNGLLCVKPDALILATGARERPRPARLVPGDRPAGVYTTGHLQNVVHLHHGTVGSRAVVVGAELVSWSAVMTLRHADCTTVLMTTTYSSPESYAAFNLGGKARFRVPIATRTRVTRIIGRPALEAVEVEHLDTGERLSGFANEPSEGVRLRPGPALRWLSPGLLRPGDPTPPRGRLLAWTDHLVRYPKIVVSQQGDVVSAKRLPWPASPGRVFRIPASLLSRVDPSGGDVTVDICR